MDSIFGPLEVLDFPEYISPGVSLQIRFVQIRGVSGFTELADENILLYPPEEEAIEPTPQPPRPPTLEETTNVNAPFVEGNLWQQSPGTTTVFTEPLTSPVFNQDWGINPGDFLAVNGDALITSETIRLDASGRVTQVPDGFFGGPVGSTNQTLTDNFLENLAKRLSISTEVSRDRDNLVVKTSLFLERDDTSLITVDSFEGHIDIDELKD
jgi:hypothetical protein